MISLLCGLSSHGSKPIKTSIGQAVACLKTAVIASEIKSEPEYTGIITEIVLLQAETI